MALTKEQIAEEKKLMEGLLPINIAAFLLPPIWGPANGIWATVLFYPAWVFVDNCIYAAVTLATPMAVILAAVMGIVIFAVTLAFARLAQPLGIRRALSKGKTKEQYIRAQRIWAVCSAIAAVFIVCLATYYNLNIRTMG